MIHCLAMCYFVLQQHKEPFGCSGHQAIIAFHCDRIGERSNPGMRRNGEGRAIFRNNISLPIGRLILLDIGGCAFFHYNKPTVIARDLP